MPSLSVERRRQIGLALAALLTVVGGIWGVHDAFTLAALVCAASLIWSSREWKALLLAGILVAAGVWWSSRDLRGCSAWWKGKLFYAKLAGKFTYVSWPCVFHQAATRCYDWEEPGQMVGGRIRLLETEVVGGRKRELFQSDLGNFWLPAPGKKLITLLIWEMTVQRDYDGGEVSVHPGDTVIDCGAHVGVFTRYALRRGAARVVAIEPDPDSLACLEKNLAEEISDGRVIVERAGVWDRQTTLTLFHVEGPNSAAAGFLGKSEDASEIPGIPVRPLDDIVRELDLDRVDFIKMDIEGSEVRALEGAQQTLARFRPRMAICSYHNHDDVEKIPRVVRAAQPEYQIHAKDIDPLDTAVGFELRTKVLFFR